MPRTVFILQTKKEPTDEELLLFRTSIIHAAGRRALGAISCVVVAPREGGGVGSRIAADPDNDTAVF